MKIVGLIIILLLLVEAIRLFQLRGQIGRYKTYWQNRATEPVPTNALTYVALGDSTAQGIGASRPENSYVGLLTDKLRQTTGCPVHVINLGVNGARVADVIRTQLPQLAKIQLPPEAVITLSVGANDIRHFNASAFQGEFEQLAARLPRQTLVADMPYFGGGRHNQSEQNAAVASQIIRKIAVGRGLTVVPLHETTKTHNSWRSYAADFFHPTDYAYRYYADTFWQTLEKRKTSNH